MCELTKGFGGGTRGKAVFIVIALTSIGLGDCGVEVGARAVTKTKKEFCVDRRALVVGEKVGSGEVFNIKM